MAISFVCLKEGTKCADNSESDGDEEDLRIMTFARLKRWNKIMQRITMRMFQTRWVGMRPRPRWAIVIAASREQSVPIYRYRYATNCSTSTSNSNLSGIDRNERRAGHANICESTSDTLSIKVINYPLQHGKVQVQQGDEEHRIFVAFSPLHSDFGSGNTKIYINTTTYPRAQPLVIHNIHLPLQPPQRLQRR